MKILKKLVVATIMCTLFTHSFSQSINWAGLQSKQKHIVHISAAWDYGLVYSAGYSYQLKYKMPALLNVSYSFSSGSNLFDDFKAKIGGAVQLYRSNNFQFNASIHGIYRRYQNPLVRLQNFGSEMTAVTGYYKSKWFVAGEAGFDKAIVTHFKHSKSFKDNVYTNVTNGWHQPSTGGNFNYGIQAGYSIRQSDMILKIGKVLTQDFKTTPLIPYYLQLSYNLKINGLVK